MSCEHHDALWRGFPKTLPEFEMRFPDEESCRVYWMELRWNGRPSCALCNSERVWRLAGRSRFECADCSHQTSITSGTLLHGTRKLADGTRTLSFGQLLDHLGTIVRNTLRPAGACPGEATFTLTTTPTPKQRRALDLVAAITV